ncbi:MAG TPA: GEVED domain-containing protein [Edaphocola sp.]|nr:GEVED domain-containing protein [Edaphocola sp.]
MVKILTTIFKIIYGIILFIISSSLHAQTLIQIGSPISSSSKFPVGSWDDYSYTQTIYAASELYAAGATSPGMITKLAYMTEYSVSTNYWQDWIVYFGNTNRKGYKTNYEAIPIGNLTEVFNGTITSHTVANEWMEIILDTPFFWDGYSNLVIAVVENTLGAGTSAYWKSCFAASLNSNLNRAISYRKNGTPINTSSLSGINKDFQVRIAHVQFEWTSVATCVGTPIAGTITGPSSICPYVPFSLELIDFSIASGLELQWQRKYFGSSSWLNITGANSNIYDLPGGITAEDDYRVIVKCIGSNITDTTDVFHLSFSPNYNRCYCIPPPPSIGDLYWIDSVYTTGALINIFNLGTGVALNSYSDYSETQIVEVEKNGSFNLMVASQNAASPGITVWIDWNQNGIFDTSEVVFKTTAGALNAMNNYTIPITIPANTPIGMTGMRIRNYGRMDITPCHQFSYGEVEDYTVSIVDNSTFIKRRDLNGDILKLYPNPTGQTVTIENKSNFKMKNIIITNVLGQQVMKLAAKESKQVINVSNLASGLYQVTIEFDEGTMNRKLEVMK